jgi:hypothetical protein
MDVKVFHIYHQIAAQSIFMTVSDAHAHVQRLPSVVMLATALEMYTTEEHVRFMLTEGLNADDVHKKCFLFTVGSLCRVKRFSREFLSRTFESG